jgi:multicomponent Na+:H+ antiporter subunit G
MMEVLVYIFLGLAAVFNLMGLLGILLFPDPYTRLQASSTCSTTAVISVFIAVMLEAGFSAITGKVLVITLFFFVSSPVGAHIIARYAWNTGIVPWRKLRKSFPKAEEGSHD